MSIEYEQEFELYHFGDSIASQMARLALAEKQISYKSHLIILESQGQHLRREYRAVNPSVLVPTLVHNGKAIPDSRHIMRYLDAYAPEQGARLLPEDPDIQTALDTMVADFALDESVGIGESFGTSAPATSVDVLTNLLKRRKLFTVIFDYLLHHPIKKRAALFIMLRIFGGAPAIAHKKAIAGVAQGLVKVDRLLDHNKDYLLGNYSIVDTMLTVHLHRLEDVKLGSVLVSGELANISAWWRRIQQRPSYQQAMLDFHSPDFRSAISEVYPDNANPYLGLLQKEIKRYCDASIIETDLAKVR